MTAEAPSERSEQELLAFACHDLRSPLSAIQLNVQSMLRKLHDGDDPSRSELIEALSRVERLVQDGALLVEDILTASRPDARQTAGEPVDFDEVLTSTIAVHAEHLRRARCDVIVTRNELMGRVKGLWKRSALKRLFSNLLQNVARHAPGAPVEISISCADHELFVSVSDGGPGLPAPAGGGPPTSQGQQDDDAREHGHGMGLWLIRRASAELGASLEILSEPGRGLTYHIVLPFERDARPPGAAL